MKGLWVSADVQSKGESEKSAKRQRWCHEDQTPIYTGVKLMGTSPVGGGTPRGVSHRLISRPPLRSQSLSLRRSEVTEFVQHQRA